MSSVTSTSGVDTGARPKILCVDDEPNVLEGLTLNLRRRFEVLRAPSGAQGLEMLASEPLVSVVISDMRMPAMDGAAFLGRAREVAPDASRILLTGQADLTSAIAAVNDGQIFRFLQKPCAPTALIPAVEAGVQQHQLVTAERVLLEQTLHGSIKALTEILAITSPASFGRATRIKQIVSDIALHLDLRDRWQVEVAAMLSPIGLITLPPATAEKVFNRQPLTREEQAMLAKVPAVTETLLASIPRLETVRAILSSFGRPPPETPATDPAKLAVERACHVLRAAVEFDELEGKGLTALKAVDELILRTGRYDADVLGALRAARGDGSVMTEMRSLPLAALRSGMVLVEDMKLKSGVLVITRGYEITDSFLERVLNFGLGTVQEPIRVLAKRK